MNNTLQFFKDKTNYSLFTEQCICIYVYPYQYLQIRKNLNFYSKADYILLDGMFLTKTFNFFKISDNKRMSIDFSGIADNLFCHILNNNKTIFFVGAKQEEVEKFSQIISQKYNGLKIVGFHHGFIKDDKQQYYLLIDKLTKLNPDFILAGMGSPLQESFLFDLKDNGWNGTGFTSGGFIYQTSVKPDYYPKLVNTLKLRWLYRGIYEPKALLKTLRIPKFVIIFLYDFLCLNLKK